MNAEPVFEARWPSCADGKTFIAFSMADAEFIQHQLATQGETLQPTTDVRLFGTIHIWPKLFTRGMPGIFRELHVHTNKLWVKEAREKDIIKADEDYYEPDYAADCLEFFAFVSSFLREYLPSLPSDERATAVTSLKHEVQEYTKLLEALRKQRLVPEPNTQIRTSFLYLLLVFRGHVLSWARQIARTSEEGQSLRDFVNIEQHAAESLQTVLELLRDNHWLFLSISTGNVGSHGTVYNPVILYSSHLIRELSHLKSNDVWDVFKPVWATFWSECDQTTSSLYLDAIWDCITLVLAPIHASIAQRNRLSNAASQDCKTCSGELVCGDWETVSWLLKIEHSLAQNGQRKNLQSSGGKLAKRIGMLCLIWCPNASKNSLMKALIDEQAFLDLIVAKTQNEVEDVCDVDSLTGIV